MMFKQQRIFVFLVFSSAYFYVSYAGLIRSEDLLDPVPDPLVAAYNNISDAERDDFIKYFLTLGVENVAPQSPLRKDVFVKSNAGYEVHNAAANVRPWGPIRLRITTNSSSASTKPIYAEFPLIYNEAIVLKQLISHARDLLEIDKDIRMECVKFQLIQGSTLLAQRSLTLARLLFSKRERGKFFTIVLFPTVKFESTVGPRLELSTNMRLDYSAEIGAYCMCKKHCQCLEFPHIGFFPTCSIGDYHHHSEEDICKICEAYYRKFNDRFKDN